MSTDQVAADQLRAFVERIERLEEEQRGINQDKSEVYKEAKGNGFDVKVLRKLIADRRKDRAELTEFETIYELYAAVLGMRSEGLVRARVEIIEEFDAETGEIIDVQPSAQPAVALAGEVDPSASSAPPSPAVDAEVIQPHDGLTASLDRAEGDADGQPIPEATPLEQPSGEKPRETAGAAADGDTARNQPMREGSEPIEAHNLEGAGSTPAPATSHNPASHFLNSKGLLRLHGCQKPEGCGSSHPRVKLCFSCSVSHDGPAYQPADDEGRSVH